MKARPHYALQRILRELDHALQGMSDTEQAHLLSELRAECWMRLLRLDEQTRTRAEWEATSPLRMLPDWRTEED